MTDRRSLPVCLLAIVLAAPAAGDAVERRGGAPALEGEIIRSDDAGVTVRSDLGAVHFVPWDRVRRVSDDSPDPRLAARMRTAQELWRARSRVERHDTTLAEPLLERLFEQFRGQTHETALVAAEGLLRCRIARADHALAVAPALEVARLRRAGVSSESYQTLPPVLDPGYALCTVLVPVWPASPILEAAARGVAAYDARGDEVVAALARLYAASMSGERPAAGDGPLPDHPGVELLARFMACVAAGDERRPAARGQLAPSLDAGPEWVQAWARYAVGISLVGEPDIASRQAGALCLLHVPARFGRSQPFLAGLALRRAADVLERIGDPEAAAALRLEVERRYPNHPPRGGEGRT